MENQAKVGKERVGQIQNIVKNLKSNLSELKNLKKSGKKYSGSQDLVNIHDQSLLKIMQLRELQRKLYIDIEKDRNEIKTEKEIIDEKSVYLQSLEYQKHTLQNNIKIANSLQLKDIHRLKQENQIQELDLITQKEDIKQILVKELKERKQHWEQLDQINKKKKKQVGEHEDKIKIYNEDLNSNLINICQQLKPLSKIFQVPTTQNPYQIHLYAQLPPMLKQVYDHLRPFIEKSDYEDMEINPINPCFMTQMGKKYELAGFELSLSFEQSSKSQKQKIEQICDDLGISLQYSNIFPLKFTIREQPELKKIFIFLDKFNTFKTEDVLKGLGHLYDYTLSEAKGSENKYFQFSDLTELALDQQSKLQYEENEGMEEEQKSKFSLEIEQQQSLANLDTESRFLLKIRHKVIKMIVYKGIQEHLQKLSISKVAKMVTFKKIDIKEQNQLLQMEENSKKNNIDEEEGEIKETLEDNNYNSVVQQQLDYSIYKFQIESLQNQGKMGGIIKIFNDYPKRLSEIKLLNGLQESSDKENNSNNITSWQRLSLTNKEDKNVKKWLTIPQQHLIEEYINDINNVNYQGEDFTLYAQFSKIMHYIAKPALIEEEKQKLEKQNTVDEEKQENKIEQEETEQKSENQQSDVKNNNNKSDKK